MTEIKSESKYESLNSLKTGNLADRIRYEIFYDIIMMPIFGTNKIVLDVTIETESNSKIINDNWKEISDAFSFKQSIKNRKRMVNKIIKSMCKFLNDTYKFKNEIKITSLSLSIMENKVHTTLRQTLIDLNI